MARLERTQVETMAQVKGLKMTPQRRAIVDYLQQAKHHPTAEEVMGAVNERFPMTSRATVYNTLNQFTGAGLLREVAIEGDRTFFDTNTSNHFHYYLGDIGGLIDIDAPGVSVTGLPALPPGTEIDRVDVIVRLRKLAVL